MSAGRNDLESGLGLASLSEWNVGLVQKQTFCDARPMSAVTPKADIDRRHRDVRLVPIAEINNSIH
jgi:hypothetical protein